MNEKNPKLRSTSPKGYDTKVEDIGRKTVKTVFATVVTTLFSIFIILIITAGTVAGAMAVYVTKCMDESSGIDLQQVKLTQNQTSIVYVPDGDEGELKEIHRFKGTENRIWVELDSIPLDLQHAFVSIEDERFYTHSGVDWKRTIGAFANVFSSSVYSSTQGGSTITQQLIKNITKENDVTFVRKVNEIFTALALTKENSKDDILVVYLNTVYLGSGSYGVNTAAEKYFGKSVSELNTAECAIIASITQSPDKYNPLRNPSETKTRQEYCLSKMLELGYITQSEYLEAKNYKLVYTNSMEYLYGEDELPDEDEEDEVEVEYQSYYIDTLFRQIRTDLCNEYGITAQEAEDKINNGGLKIIAAVDLDAQAIVDDTFENYKGFLSETNQAIKSQAAITVMDYNGRVVAISGGAGEKSGNLCLNRATSSPRPPGSAIKPLTAYAPGIEKNAVTWGTSEIDGPAMEINGNPWPRNYSGTYSNTPVSVQNALERSLNTIPVKIVKKLGISTCFDFAKNKMHLSTLVESGSKNDQTYSSLSVGGMTKGVTTWDMTAAFATFGNGGKYYYPYTYYEVRNNQEQILLEKADIPEQAISEQTAFIMNQMLQTVITGSSGTGRSYGINNQPVFAKTGTTTDVKDRYFVGGTPYYVAAVWYGYDIPKKLTMSTNPAGDVWKMVMKQLHSGLSRGKFPTCTGVKQMTYCRNTGKIAGATCTDCATGWFKTDYTGGTCNGVHTYYGNDDSSTESTSGVDQSSRTSASKPSTSTETTASVARPTLTIPARND